MYVDNTSQAAFFLSRLTWPVWTLGLWMVLYASRGRFLCIRLTSYHADALCSLQDLSATSPLQVNETGARSGVLTTLLYKDSGLRDLPGGLGTTGRDKPSAVLPLLPLWYSTVWDEVVSESAWSKKPAETESRPLANYHAGRSSVLSPFTGHMRMIWVLIGVWAEPVNKVTRVDSVSSPCSVEAYC